MSALTRCERSHTLSGRPHNLHSCYPQSWFDKMDLWSRIAGIVYHISQTNTVPLCSLLAVELDCPAIPQDYDHPPGTPYLCAHANKGTITRQPSAYPVTSSSNSSCGYKPIAPTPRVALLKFILYYMSSVRHFWTILVRLAPSMGGEIYSLAETARRQCRIRDRKPGSVPPIFSHISLVIARLPCPLSG
ncbi:hypothetical protein BDV26DRAFT_59710 [Aspergillus bertholletiae]|uniref:Uncharacterized protein n=1 Tax=Aspergillus bertholletiae TaxID=1226010 RepID=A0A5N7AV14_9EURO|nr:hypothetical protein BDV26DRAFT_59710 [Aspergillus bertholletiae]